MAAYYNENDPFAAQWLRNLIAAGHIAPGDVDERSITDVRPEDLRGYTQHHFFAGVGVWSLALRRAGWPDARSVWTGSCPCQPFSSAGAQAGFADERHLWPHFYWLISQFGPAEVFGEQVASKAAEPWIDLVQADLEAVGYTFAAVPFPSAGVGAPHIRDRLFWMGHTDHPRSQGHAGDGGATGGEIASGSVAKAGLSDRLADAYDTGLQGRERQGPAGAEGSPGGHAAECGGADKRLANTDGDGRSGQKGDTTQPSGHRPEVGVPDGGRASSQGLANPDGYGRDQTGQRVASSGCDGLVGDRVDAAREPTSGAINGFWRIADWLFCRDGKWRPVESGSSPLVDGLPASLGRVQPELRALAELAGLDGQSLAGAKSNRTGRLKGYGNALNAEAAKVFIEAYLEHERSLGPADLNTVKTERDDLI